MSAREWTPVSNHLQDGEIPAVHPFGSNWWARRKSRNWAAKHFPLLWAQSQQSCWNHKAMLKMSSFTMCFPFLLGVYERAYISALRDFETHRNRDKEKLIKLSVCLQALLVIVNSKISCSPATFQRIPEGYHYRPGRRKEGRLEVWPAAFPICSGEMGCEEEGDEGKLCLRFHSRRTAGTNC